MPDLYLQLQGRRAPFRPAAAWELLSFAEFEDRPAPADVIGMVRRALAEPDRPSALAADRRPGATRSPS